MKEERMINNQEISPVIEISSSPLHDPEEDEIINA